MTYYHVVDVHSLPQSSAGFDAALTAGVAARVLLD